MEKVRSGEAVNIKASTWNAFVDAANWVKEAKQNSLGAGVRSGIGGGIVPMKNMEESHIRDSPRSSSRASPSRPRRTRTSSFHARPCLRDSA